MESLGLKGLKNISRSDIFDHNICQGLGDPSEVMVYNR